MIIVILSAFGRDILSQGSERIADGLRNVRTRCRVEPRPEAIGKCKAIKVGKMANARARHVIRG